MNIPIVQKIYDEQKFIFKTFGVKRIKLPHCTLDLNETEFILENKDNEGDSCSNVESENDLALENEEMIMDTDFVNLKPGPLSVKRKLRDKNATEFHSFPSTKSCTCSITKLKTNLLPEQKCEAVDSINDNFIYCNDIAKTKYYRTPSLKLPSIVLCSNHEISMLDHKFCPICGQCCVEGSFIRCTAEEKCSHFMHEHCCPKDSWKFKCAHCLSIVKHQGRYYLLRDKKVIHKKGKRRLGMEPIISSSVSSQNLSVASIYNENVNSFNKPSEKIDIVMFGKLLAISTKIPVTEKDQLLKYLSLKSNKERYKLNIKSLATYIKLNDVYGIAECKLAGLNFEEKISKFSRSALLYAVSKDKFNVVEFLLTIGCNVDSKNADGNTSLLLAAEMGNIRLAKLLIVYNADVNKRNNIGKNVLHLTATNGNVDLMKIWVETYKLNVNCQDSDGFTPLDYAAEVAKIECGKYLIESGANPMIRDYENSTAIHWASVGGSSELVFLCYENGCDINLANKNGDTPLHIATRRNHVNLVYNILQFSQKSLTMSNIYGQTPVDVATSLEENSLITFMKTKLLTVPKTFSRERLITIDLSRGIEAVQIPVFNGIDDDDSIDLFFYVKTNIEFDDLSRDIRFSVLNGCKCDSELTNCSSIDCNCVDNSLGQSYTEDGRLIEKKSDSIKNPKVFECNDRCKCSTKCSNRVVQNGITYRLDLFKTKNKGWGVRAAQFIPKNAFVCEYIGETISDSAAETRKNDSYIYELNEDRHDTHCIDAATYANIARFINHNCEPNLKIIRVYTNCQDLNYPRICFFTLKDIDNGCELGYDYGDTFWAMKTQRNELKCACGAESCRYK